MDYTTNDIQFVKIVHDSRITESITIPDNDTINDYVANTTNDTQEIMTIESSNGIITAYCYIKDKIIKHLTIDNNVNNIEQFAFADCDIIDVTADNLDNFVLGNSAFINNSYLQSIKINNVTYIGDSCFLGCSSLCKIELGNKLQHIKNNAFAGCENLTTFNMPNTVTELGIGSFTDCINLSQITISDNIITIEPFTFNNCNLTEITIPKGVLYVDNFAFSNNINLTKVMIHNSVDNIKISNEAFNGCPNVEIYYTN